MSRSRSENRSPDSKKSTPSYSDLLRLMNELTEYIDEKGEIINENHWRDIVEIVGASMVGTSMDGEYVDIDFDAMDSILFDQLETWCQNNPPSPPDSQNRKRQRSNGAGPMVTGALLLSNPKSRTQTSVRPKILKSTKEDARYIYYLAETALAIAPTVLYEVIKKMYSDDQDSRVKDTVTGTMNDFRKRMKDNPEELKNIYASNGQNGDRFPDLFHPVFKDEIKKILDAPTIVTSESKTEKGNEKENKKENIFYNPKIERIWILSGLPTHIIRDTGKLSMMLNDKAKEVIERHNYAETRFALPDDAGTREQLNAWYNDPELNLKQLKTKIENMINVIRKKKDATQNPGPM